MLVRLISLIALIAVSFSAGVYSTTPEGQKIIADVRAMLQPPDAGGSDSGVGAEAEPATDADTDQ
ncbi:MAG: hypothetical protein AAFY06_01690 [Pseudomonadota bacterium]